jgi:ArsR family transcriptional regulator, arsenate/arsenite/antimonite-responsive transcriptional repressor
MLEAVSAVGLLSALAHEARLQAFRLLVRAGPDGLSAGQLAVGLGLGATATSFHLNRMRQAGLVQRRRAGQQLIYSANFALMRELRAFLDAECCAEAAEPCGPDCHAPASAARHTRPG